MIVATDTSLPAVALLQSALERAGTRQVVDRCSGGGGPWPGLLSRLDTPEAPVDVRLTDRYPNREACERAWKRRGITNGVYEADEPWRPGKDRASRHKYALRYGWWGFNSGARNTALAYGLKAVSIRPASADGWKLLASALIKPMPESKDEG